MELCLIAPPQQVKLTNLLPGRFCLADIAIKYLEYRVYFMQASKDGYDVILDNGAFEGTEVDSEELIELAKKIEPKVLIVPDKINSRAGQNWDYGLSFLNRHSKKLDCEVMFVPHMVTNSISERDQINSQLKAVIQRETPYRWIGINRDFARRYIGVNTHMCCREEEMTRLQFCYAMHRDFNTDLLGGPGAVKWHFLGVGSDVRLIQNYWFVSSMDTASFFWEGCRDHLMTEEGILERTLKRPKDYFQRQYDLSNHEGPCEEHFAIEHNCEIAQGYADKAKVLRSMVIDGQL